MSLSLHTSALAKENLDREPEQRFLNDPFVTKQVVFPESFSIVYKLAFGIIYLCNRNQEVVGVSRKYGGA
jgi:hypothetical protein